MLYVSSLWPLYEIVTDRHIHYVHRQNERKSIHLIRNRVTPLVLNSNNELDLQSVFFILLIVVVCSTVLKLYYYHCTKYSC